MQLILLAAGQGTRLPKKFKTSPKCLVKINNKTISTECNVIHTGTGWEELKYTFSSSKKYNRLVIFIDGPGTTSGSFYIDDNTKSNSKNQLKK